MATGSQLMTTYYAKRIMGDNAAANASDALLQTGEHINVDTWILHRENRTNLYGIKYKYDNTETSNVNNGHDKIELYGGYQISNVNMPTAWVQLDTGDIHTIGSFNGDHLNLIGTGNTVLGYDEDNTAPYIELRNSDNTKNIRISLATTSNKNGITINQQDNIQSFLSVHGYLWLYSPDVDMTDANNGVSSGSIIEQIQAIDSNGYDFGLVQFNAASSGAISNLVCARNIVDSTNKYIGIYSVLNKDGTGNIYLRNNAVTAQDAIACEFGSTENTITISGKTVIEYNNQWLTPARIQLNRYDTTAYTDRACVGVTNGNLHLDAYNTSGIYLNHYSSGGNIYFNGSTYYINGGNYNGNSATATKWAAAQKVYVTLGTASTTTTIQGGSTSAETIGVDGTLGVGNGGTGKTSWTKGGILYASATNTLAQIADGSADKVLRATASATYSWLSYTSSSTASTLVYRDASKNFSAGTITASLKGNVTGNVTGNCSGSSGSCTGNAATATTSSKVTIAAGAGSTMYPVALVGSYSASAQSIYVSQNVKASNTALSVSGTITAANVTLNAGGRLGKASGNLYIGDSGNSGWVLTQDICSHSGTGDTYWSLRVAGVAHFKTAYGAVWNDYAEMRNVPKAQMDIHRIYDDKGEIERDYPYAGHCVYEIGDGTMEVTNQRLLKGCKIISDTFGFCIGETENCCTPIAVTGRVLAYPYENIEEYKNHIGDCVCSGPDGTISIMTQEEKIKYPECIVGTISEIPTYDVWHCGNKLTKPIKVNGRIWVYVK